ncbi:hypothetical protein [Fibrobacter sp.]|uniref:hypothetical protein n=1 Tax=Fibrobacter sp. TaxID=35828 RepID=UPI0025C03499|nr:hypothetical protein [Fibrobacter sp.]MBR3073470.1 hypothetical protein [Fibrobacter sp.]
MQKSKFHSICKVFTAFVCFIALDLAWGEERSVWQRFVNFFTPSGSIQGEGPVFDELRGVESQIDKIEVQYTRERRPGNKTRFRKQLDSLRSVRDSLITVIENMPMSSGSVVNSSVTVQSVSSNGVQSSAALSSADVPASSSLPASSSSTVETVPATATVPAVASAEAACVHDTVFVHDTLVVRDTVVIHDTLYVVLANKPEAAAPKEKKKADKTSKK